MLRKTIPVADEIHFNDHLILKYINADVIVYLNTEVKNKCFKVEKYENYIITTFYIDELEVLISVEGNDYDEISKVVLFDDFTDEIINIYDNFCIVKRTITIK